MELINMDMAQMVVDQAIEIKVRKWFSYKKLILFLSPLIFTVILSITLTVIVIFQSSNTETPQYEQIQIEYLKNDLDKKYIQSEKFRTLLETTMKQNYKQIGLVSNETLSQQLNPIQNYISEDPNQKQLSQLKNQIQQLQTLIQQQYNQIEDLQQFAGRKKCKKGYVENIDSCIMPKSKFKKGLSYLEAHKTCVEQNSSLCSVNQLVNAIRLKIIPTYNFDNINVWYISGDRQNDQFYYVQGNLNEPSNPLYDVHDREVNEKKDFFTLHCCTAFYS